MRDIKIIIEGEIGSGKTTIATLFAKFMEDRGATIRRELYHPNSLSQERANTIDCHGFNLVIEERLPGPQPEKRMGNQPYAREQLRLLAERQTEVCKTSHDIADMQLLLDILTALGK